MNGQVVTWGVREPPLPICGMLARGDVAHALALRLADVEPPVDYFMASDALVALGDANSLPWVDGVTWLGRDHSLLCPTTLFPKVHPDLLIGAIRRASEVEGIAVATPDRSMMLRRPKGEVDPTALAAFTKSGDSDD